jgi:hypothetical protein
MMRARAVSLFGTVSSHFLLTTAAEILLRGHDEIGATTKIAVLPRQF